MIPRGLIDVLNNDSACLSTREGAEDPLSVFYPCVYSPDGTSLMLKRLKYRSQIGGSLRAAGWAEPSATIFGKVQARSATCPASDSRIQMSRTHLTVK